MKFLPARKITQIIFNVADNKMKEEEEILTERKLRYEKYANFFRLIMFGGLLYRIMTNRLFVTFYTKSHP